MFFRRWLPDDALPRQRAVAPERPWVPPQAESRVECFRRLDHIGTGGLQGKNLVWQSGVAQNFRIAVIDLIRGLAAQTI